MYDLNRTALDGCRTFCGLHVSDRINWTCGYTENEKRVQITCKACRKSMESRVPVAQLDRAASS
jgi:hypothetical protein